MKLYNLDNPEAFLKAVSGCKGDILLKTPQGDVLNLKSKLTKYVALVELLGVKSDIIDDIEIEFTDRSDIPMLMYWLMSY